MTWGVPALVALLVPPRVAAAGDGCTIDGTKYDHCKNISAAAGKLTQPCQLGWTLTGTDITMAASMTGLPDASKAQYLAVGFGSTPGKMAPASAVVASFVGGGNGRFDNIVADHPIHGNVLNDTRFP